MKHQFVSPYVLYLEMLIITRRGFPYFLLLWTDISATSLCPFSWLDKISNYQSQVVAGELELKECNLNWSPEDFESKLQVST